jgi:hypothetical protein
LDPVIHIPYLWSLHVPVPLRELLWKHSASALPLGSLWFGRLGLGQLCRCRAEMSLLHVWSSCPAYDLSPLSRLVFDFFDSLEPSVLSTSPSSWDGNLWYPLFALRTLDSLPGLPASSRSLLGRSRRSREWVLGSFLWLVWRLRMKEVHDPDFRFIPSAHSDSLAALLSSPAS